MSIWRLLALLLLLPGGVVAGPPSGVEFRDVTAESGVDFRHTFGDRDFSRILKATGSGVAIFDADGDGDLDLYFVNGTWLPGISDEAEKGSRGATNRLFRNEGNDPATGTPRFRDVTAEAGVGDGGYGMGAAVADYDNDGDLDLYVTNYGPNVLYRNRGDGTFEDVTASAGVAGPKVLNGRPKWSTNAVFTDYDRDGNLDLFVCDYLAFDPANDDYYAPEGFPGPLQYLGQASILYRSNGDGTFTDVTEKAGVLKPEGHGMGAAAADLNGDGWPDLYQANDAQTNFLFVNNGDGTFRDTGVESNAVKGQGGENSASMHPCFADYDNDGWIDIFIPDLSYFSLFRNRTGDVGTLFFEDRTDASGVAEAVANDVGWGGFFFDYDNDGWRDVFVATGEAHRPENQPNLVLRNLGPDAEGNVGFREVSLELGKRVFWERRLSRGASFGDLDGDGDLDVVVVNIDTKAKGKEGLPTILLNEGGDRGAWLDVRLRGTRSNRDGIGAKVVATAGERTWVAEMHTAPSYLSATQPVIHFGLGDAEKVDRLTIIWPSGAKQVTESVPTRQTLVVTEPEGKGGAR